MVPVKKSLGSLKWKTDWLICCNGKNVNKMLTKCLFLVCFTQKVRVENNHHYFFLFV